ncbi:MAG: hypothetical protein NVS2B7_01040 [Herpetosiphon sp.]
MISSAPDRSFDHAVVRLDAWLETMRGPDGYGGPVAHWWQQSLLYTGAGRDWRYEGIVAGYLNLWETSGDEGWLLKACRAGDHLVHGQLPGGHYAASGFETNPVSAGTPHEAACDVALLLLARALRSAGRPQWQRYADTAERNIRSFYIEQLWDPEMRAFRDDPMALSFVPNKVSTACEALFLLSELTGDTHWVEQYALPNLQYLLHHQVRGGACDGAIAQNSFGSRIIDKYFPIYIARCVAALLNAYHWTREERFAECALRAMQFIMRQVHDDGSLPTVVYPGARSNDFPAWIAPLGDVLRAADQLAPLGFDRDIQPIVERLLGGQDESGAIQLARGFAAQAGGRQRTAPDLRDVLHVVGWCDKAFRYLASHVDSVLPLGTSDAFETQCTFRGHLLRFLETPLMIEITTGTVVKYRWYKGEPWPARASLEFWIR